MKGAQPRKCAVMFASTIFHAGCVGDADVADLAGAHQVLERRHRFLDRRVHVPVVQPIEIDVVGLEAAQRILAGRDNVLAARSTAVGVSRIEVAAELRRDDEAVAPGGVASEMIADDLLGVAFRVEVRGVDEVAAKLDEAVDDSLRLLDAGTPAEIFPEGHPAKANRAEAEAGAPERHIVVERHTYSRSELLCLQDM